MAVKMRLTRMGKKKKPLYRIVVADSRNARDGKVLDEIGTYDPNTDPSTFKLDDIIDAALFLFFVLLLLLIHILSLILIIDIMNPKPFTI